MAQLKLKGYVLLESMFSMIIVMMCFGFSVMIYNTVVAGSKNKLKVLAGIEMQNEAIRSKKENRLLDETIQCQEFLIEKRIIPYARSESLFQLHYTAITPNGAKLAEYNEIILVP
jgi:hypothetical protein